MSAARNGSYASSRRITTAITQVAANKLKIKIDAKCDLGSSHCYHAVDERPCENLKIGSYLTPRIQLDMICVFYFLPLRAENKSGGSRVKNEHNPATTGETTRKKPSQI